jgi:hypothetical protein
VLGKASNLDRLFWTDNIYEKLLKNDYFGENPIQEALPDEPYIV